MLRNLEKVQKYPQPVKWAIIFRANPSKLILKNIMFKYTCFVYGLLSLLSIGLNSSSKNNFLNKFCFWYGKCQNSIIILQLFLLKNQITSENFKYCKERKELSWELSDWQPIKSLNLQRQIPPQVKEKNSSRLL